MLKKLLLLSVLPGIVWAAEGQGVDALNGEAGLGVDSVQISCLPSWPGV